MDSPKEAADEIDLNSARALAESPSRERRVKIKVKFVDDSMVQIQATERQFRCSFCSQTCLTGFDFIKHLGNHSAVETHDCAYCRKTFLWQDELSQHLKMHKSIVDSLYNCFLCEKKFMSKKASKKHLEWHRKATLSKLKRGEDIKPVKETHSLSQKPEKSENSKRKSVEISDSAFRECQKMEERHISPTVYRKRNKEMKLVENCAAVESEEPKKIYECAFCTSDFPDKTELRDHLFTHELQVPLVYYCPHCDQGFKTNIDLIEHLKIHAGDQQQFSRCNDTDLSPPVVCLTPTPFRCKECNKAFARRDLYRSHLETHAKGKTDSRLTSNLASPNALPEHPSPAFSCLHCGRLFEDSLKLNLHLETHARGTKADKETAPLLNSRNENLCDQKMRCITNMKKTHTPLTGICKFCGKAFSRNADLMFHLHSHSGPNPFHCLHCNFKASKMDTLLKHSRTHGLIAYYKAKKFLAQ